LVGRSRKGSHTDIGRRWVMHSVWDNQHDLRCGGNTVIAERLYSPSCLEEVFSETRIQPVAPLSLCFRAGAKPCNSKTRQESEYEGS